jgi:5'-deoxynucleotidase YfbR-like HD superfamily hydrolase
MASRVVMAVNVAVGPTIMLRSGAQFDFLDPWSSEFTIEDIAHGLSLICRYAGQCDRFYSVAEHSLHVSDTVPRFAYAALMHDAAEAFVGDVTRPLKQLLPAYKKIEHNVESAIFQRFGVPHPLPETVKEADLRVLAAEQEQIMPYGTNRWAIDGGIHLAPIRVESLAPQEAKRLFLERFTKLRPLSVPAIIVS